MPADTPTREQSLPQRLATQAMNDELPSIADCLAVLTDPSLDVYELVAAAYQVRKAHWGRTVTVHILNNAQNGNCPEDCSYCSQAKTSKADIEDYPIKDDEEILLEAKKAHEAGAKRYCMVFAGRGPNSLRIKTLERLVRKVKNDYPSLEVCVSAGLLDDAKAELLKGAGLDRLNHNLNTGREHYGEICSTHTYDDRINTLRSAQRAGLGMCSGLIAGMGETPDELIEIATTLREMGVHSIPVNFLLPIEGNQLTEVKDLTPEQCLRILCLFRFVCPRAELRAAAGREFHLRSLEPVAMQVANSLFLDGYLNAKGRSRKATLSMLRDAGFEIQSDQDLDALIAAEDAPETYAGTPSNGQDIDITLDGKTACLKTQDDLRPAQTSACCS